MIISFSYTTPALLAGVKTVTRRDWDSDYAQRFRQGMLVDAYDRLPRRGGKKVATIRLTADPSYERLGDMPDSDYEAEGFAWFEQHPDKSGVPLPIPFSQFVEWRRECADEYEWVIRFELCNPISD